MPRHFDRRFRRRCKLSFYTASEAAFFKRADCYLNSNNVLCLRAFLAVSYGELNLLAFCQGLESAALNSAVVNEYVRAAFTSDEPKAFCFVEKLY